MTPDDEAHFIVLCDQQGEVQAVWLVRTAAGREGGRSRMRTVTLDTNVADRRDVIEAAQRRGLEVSVVPVTEREMSPSDIRPGVDARLLDMCVLSDSQIGTMDLVSEMGADLLEQILRIISNGS